MAIESHMRRQGLGLGSTARTWFRCHLAAIRLKERSMDASHVTVFLSPSEKCPMRGTWVVKSRGRRRTRPLPEALLFCEDCQSQEPPTHSHTPYPRTLVPTHKPQKCLQDRVVRLALTPTLSSKTALTKLTSGYQPHSQQEAQEEGRRGG